MDAMNLSLDEIIKKKAIGKRPNAGRGAKKLPAKGTVPSSARAGKGKKPPISAKSGRKKVVSTRSGAGTTSPGRIGKPNVIVDARMKIIQKKRAQIRDARDKLVEIARNSGDARLRLLKRKGKLPPPGNGILKKRTPVTSISRGKTAFVDSMDVDYDVDEIDLHRPIVPLKRTVRNEMFTVPRTMPPLPTFSRSIRNTSPPPPVSSQSWNTDPFDCYEVHPVRPSSVSSSNKTLPPLPPTSSSSSHYDDLPRRGSSGLSRSTRGYTPPSSHHTTAIYVDSERPHLSSSMRARLERAPNPHESMGIFAKMPPEDHIPPPSSNSSSSSRYHHHHHPTHHSSSSQHPRSPSPPSPPILGYRIVVSNLHPSVTQNDIKELFEDIGDLLESRLVRPGVAEVIYRSLKDAEEAVDTYHNRQLDGQPMKCLLVKPRASNRPTGPAIGGGGGGYSSSSRSLKPPTSAYSSSLGSKKSQVEIDIDALHTVLFRRDH